MTPKAVISQWVCDSYEQLKCSKVTGISGFQFYMHSHKQLSDYHME